MNCLLTISRHNYNTVGKNERKHTIASNSRFAKQWQPHNFTSSCRLQAFLPYTWRDFRRQMDPWRSLGARRSARRSPPPNCAAGVAGGGAGTAASGAETGGFRPHFAGSQCPSSGSSSAFGLPRVLLRTSLLATKDYRHCALQTRGVFWAVSGWFSSAARHPCYRVWVRV